MQKPSRLTRLALAVVAALSLASCGGTKSTSVVSTTTPTDNTTPVTTAAVISADLSYACAVVSGAAKCWGDNLFAELGDGTSNDSSTPVQVKGLESGVTAIDTGGVHTCAVVSGAAKCWGNTLLGYFAINTPGDYSLVPVQVKGLERGVTAISAGLYSYCVAISGAAKCWGDNDDGQLGDGTMANSTTPVQVKGLESGVTAISSGDSYSCAVVSDAAKCWGYNYDGTLGNGTKTSSSTPVQVKGL